MKKRVCVLRRRRRQNLRARVIGFIYIEVLVNVVCWGGDMDSPYCFSFIYFECIVSVCAYMYKKRLQCVRTRVLFIPFYMFSLARCKKGAVRVVSSVRHYTIVKNILCFEVLLWMQQERYFRGAHSCSVRP